MKQTLLLFSFLFILSCGNTGNSNQKILPDSSGNINNLSVVIENDLWEGSIGEAIRNTLAAPVDGLPQEEPLFSMSLIPPTVFNGFATKNRTVFKVEQGGESSVKILSDVYAHPQKVILVSGKTEENIIEQIENNAQKIIAALKSEEIKEKQRRINLSLHANNTIEEKLGVNIKFPSAYRVAKEEGNFYWVRKDISKGMTNILLYELPYGSVRDNDSLGSQITKIRDSIGQVHIHGVIEGTYMVTEKAYTPFLTKTIIDNKVAVETRGIWDLKNAFMAGPFVNYVIDDIANKRLLVLEGFVFAPSAEKRDYMFELEAIIRSLKIK